MKDPRCAVYLRVSTDDQTTANQVPELERLIARRELVLVRTYTETISGAARHRPELERLMADAACLDFDVVLVWSLDRFGRRMKETVDLVLELERYGVDLVSARDSWLDMTGPARKLLVSIFAWVAEQERERIVERTNAGIARARAQGKRLGRPSISLNPHALELELAKGGSLELVARRLDVSRATLCRELARFRKLGSLKNGTPKPGW